MSGMAWALMAYLAPFMPVSIVVANFVPDSDQQGIIATAMLQQFFSLQQDHGMILEGIVGSCQWCR